MRVRLLLILFTLTILSVASGLGLRTAFAWTPPAASPPDGNVPPPINAGASDQIKTGGLTIGGSFVVGAPLLGAQGAGSINAQKICINGDCLTSWGGGQAFVQNGNSFGALATLGTIDNFPLAFETNSSEKMRIDTAGNVGIGTTNTTYKLMIAGTAPRIYLMPSGGSNSELDFGSPGLDTNWAIYRDTATDQLRFWGTNAATGQNWMTITNVGNIGLGTTDPHNKLTIAGDTPREYLWPSGGGNPELDFGNVAGDNHWAIYRDLASNELRFWQGTGAGGNNNITLNAHGDIDSRGCFGSIYVGQTQSSYTGNLNGAANVGYNNANNLCATTCRDAFGQSCAGSHVCTTSEILETIKCNQASLPTNSQAWISNGPPGYTARANDCTGWTSSSPAGDGSTVYGALWAFDANGGVGWVTTCNQALKFACCK